MENRQELLQKINEISFAVNDLTLYLDTHPTDIQALEKFDFYAGERKRLMREYEMKFEPLTIDCVKADTIHDHNEYCPYPQQKHFTWVDGPAAWEGGTL